MLIYAIATETEVHKYQICKSTKNEHAKEEIKTLCKWRGKGCWYMCSTTKAKTMNLADATWLMALKIEGGATLLMTKKGNNRKFRGKMRVVPGLMK